MLKYLKYHHKTKNSRVEWINAPDIKKNTLNIIKALNLNWINTSRIFCFRSFGTKTHAKARIWGLAKIWQKSLNTKPAYILEVISEKFDLLSKHQKDEILIHEIAHIPKNFSGALLPHYRKGQRKFYDRVRILIAQYKQNKI